MDSFSLDRYFVGQSFIASKLIFHLDFSKTPDYNYLGYQMLPFKTILLLDRGLATPLYLQLCGQLIQEITGGVIPKGLRLPGSRTMADMLGLSRKTVNQAYEELEAQGWVNIVEKKGAFVSQEIPIFKKRNIAPQVEGERTDLHRRKSGFPLPDQHSFLSFFQPPTAKSALLAIDTGYPDTRLAPARELAQSFQRVLTGRKGGRIMNYAPDFYGHPNLIQEVLKYLAETRGIIARPENLFISRGSLMAFSAIFQLLLQPGDKVVTGDVSFQVADNIIRIAGGELLHVPVDEMGIDVDALETLCEKQVIRAVFVMPHHHHPTTVSLSCGRRVKLLQLAEKHGFAIVEDDYDYDFHYDSSPILPMASIDRAGTVIYVGSFSKTLVPGLRIGFILAPEDVIARVARLSRFMDCHGNTALEKALAQLFQEGIIRRHLKKSLKCYHQRRDLFCELLQTELASKVSFRKPEGGLAVWVHFNDDFPLATVRTAALQRGLLISRTVFCHANGRPINAIRMGFASLSEQELLEAVGVLKSVLSGYKK